jgi:hypothetical protein
LFLFHSEPAKLVIIVVILSVVETHSQRIRVVLPILHVVLLLWVLLVELTAEVLKILVVVLSHHHTTRIHVVASLHHGHPLLLHQIHLLLLLHLHLGHLLRIHIVHALVHHHLIRLSEEVVDVQTWLESSVLLLLGSVIAPHLISLCRACVQQVQLLLLLLLLRWSVVLSTTMLSSSERVG